MDAILSFRSFSVFFSKPFKCNELKKNGKKPMAFYL